MKKSVFDEDAGAFGFFAGVLFFDFVEGTEAFGFEAALGKGRFAGAGVVEADEKDADFAFLTLPRQTVTAEQVCREVGRLVEWAKALLAGRH